MEALNYDRPNEFIFDSYVFLSSITYIFYELVIVRNLNM